MLRKKCDWDIDYKYINSCTEPIQGPMPLLSEDWYKITGANYFLSVDFLKGFWQLALAEESQELLAFITPEGVFKPTRAPQGCVDAPLYFHNEIHHIFREFIESNKMLLWIDDVLIFAKTWEEYLDLVKRFFDRCREYSLQVNIKKTTLVSHEAIFCGREVNGKGVKMQARNLETFQQMPVPKDAGSLSQFLMGINWMSDSISPVGNSKILDVNESWAALSKPLWDILNDAKLKCGSSKKLRYKNVSLENLGWNETHTKAYEKIKEKLTHCISSAFVQPGAVLCLFTDASDLYHAAMLTQVLNWDKSKEVHEQKHTVVACASGAFKGAELNYRINEKEAFPLIRAVREWEHLLHNGEGFNVHGDHKNLIHLFDPKAINPPLSKGASHRIYNWLYLLGQFKINVMKHIAGEDNCWADLLSRWGNAAANDNKEESINSNAVYMNKERVQINKLRFSTTRKRKSSQLDGDTKRELTNLQLKLMYAYGRSRTELPSLAIIGENQRVEHLTVEEKDWLEANKGSITIVDGIIYYKEKIWIPHKQLELITRLCIGAHCGDRGHRSIQVTLDYLKEFVWWMNMDEYVHTFNSKCLLCIKQKNSSERVPRPEGSQPASELPGEVITMDFMYIGKPHAKGDHDYTYILVIKDMCSNYVELIPCESADSDHACDALQWWVARYGYPKKIISDRGTHFTAGIVKELSRYLNVDHHFTLAYSPWSNGSVERVNREIKALLKLLLKENKQDFNDWPYALAAVMNVINVTPSKSLGNHSSREIFLGLPEYKPFRVMFGKPRDKGSKLSKSTELNFDKANISIFIDALSKLHKERVNDANEAKRLNHSNNRKISSNSSEVRKFRATELGIRESDLTMIEVYKVMSLQDKG